MERFDSSAGLRAFIEKHKRDGKTISFVPTMGGLHEGHKSCIEIARRLGDVLVASIFLNPTQFGPGEDLGTYPATPAEDLARCEAWGCDAVFTPSEQVMYPTAQDVWVEPGDVSKPLCGRGREGHFRGVATVVAKLLNLVAPHVAVFGQKDAQQALVIRHMVEQLDIPVRLALSPTVREPDGLACSTRNGYLSAEERERAPAIYASLRAGFDALRAGERDPETIRSAVRGHLAGAGVGDVEYVELLRVPDLAEMTSVEGRVLLAVAARIGETRLIDNVVIDVVPGGEVAEAGLF